MKGSFPVKEKIYSLLRDSLNLPNVLTLFRLFLVPVFAMAYLDGHTIRALVFFCVASLTDMLDGYLARKNHQITSFGKLMDPLADKLLVLTALLLHTITGAFPWPAVCIVFIKEILMIIGALLLLNRDVVIPSNIIGKTATCLFVAALITGFFHTQLADAHFPADIVLLWASVAMTIAAFFSYARSTWSQLFPGKQKH